MKFMDVDYFDYDTSNTIILRIDTGKDSRENLDRLWKISSFMDVFDLNERKNLLEGKKFFDFGYVQKEKISAIIKKLEKDKKVPITFSRIHLTSLDIINSLSDNFKLIVFDAHADLLDNYIDEKLEKICKSNNYPIDRNVNDSTWLLRLLERKKIETLTIGTRALDEDEFDRMKSFDIEYITPSQIKKSLDKTLDKIKNFSENSNIYISFDVDVFDPSLMPYVDFPEPGGLNYFEVERIIKNIQGNIIGVDISCIKIPKYAEFQGFLISKLAVLLMSKTK